MIIPLRSIIIVLKLSWHNRLKPIEGCVVSSHQLAREGCVAVSQLRVHSNQYNTVTISIFALLDMLHAMLCVMIVMNGHERACDLHDVASIETSHAMHNWLYSVQYSVLER